MATTTVPSVDVEEMKDAFTDFLHLYQRLIGCGEDFQLILVQEGLHRLAFAFPTDTPMYEETLHFLRAMEEEEVVKPNDEAKRKLAEFEKRWRESRQ